ncbi:MAG: DUF6869 domain-containing protein [Pseudomonadota bacterium]
MTEKTLSAEQLLATFWLNTIGDSNPTKCNLENLRRFAAAKCCNVSDAALQEAAKKVSGDLFKDDVDGWITLVCFFGHPLALWNFLIDAVAMAETDEHLGTIAAGPAEHLLSYYGSLIPLFERQAQRDSKFKRMLTGVWRLKMCDEVWLRLRKVQADEQNPLPEMIPLEHGAEWMRDSLSEEDRKNADKGRYVKDSKGFWQKSN